MKWFQSIFHSGHEHSIETLQSIQDKFKSFRSLLDKNNQVLKIISDMEEKSQGEYLFDMNYISKSLIEVRAGIREIIEDMISLGGDEYLPLRERFLSIDDEIEKILPGNRPIEKDEYTLPFEKIGRDRVNSVGSKNAQLGEMSATLGLPVPAGFAISAWAYKRFIDANDLQARISKRIAMVDIKRYDDLVKVSDETRAMIQASPVPDDLEKAILNSYDELARRSSGERFALRSSAIGEDTQFSFAGQYASFLNVRNEEIIEKYREVIASKFTPKAIYYFLSHGLTESQLAMSVGCVAMVDAAASGVLYTKDPVQPNDGCMLINAIYGLGKYLVDGTLTPDTFRVSRDDGSVKESVVSTKTVRLMVNREGGTIEEEVPESERNVPSIGENLLNQLAQYALKIEEHYGCPQDIEWAVDRSGKLFLLQTRPLRIMDQKEDIDIDTSSLKTLFKGGITVCPGAGGGPVFHAKSAADLPKVPEGAVLVARNPFPGLITVLDKVNALLTEVGGVASHMATIAREYRLPTLAGVKDTHDIPSGKEITVDATGAAIYEGVNRELIEARRPEYELFDDTDIFAILEELLTKISPLKLIRPSAPDFLPQNCRTFHDITRYCHQQAMEEMFSGSREMAGKHRVSCRLKSDIPLNVDIIYLDKDPSYFKKSRFVLEDEISSIPMEALWNGVKQEGWPKTTPRADFKGMMTVISSGVSAGGRADFSENSYAILSEEYMIISLRMGYHFTTMESMCTDEPSKNYIRMQYKEGGASQDRRVRRIKLIMDILSKLGFEHRTKGDFLDTMVVYDSREGIIEKLKALGRITMMTKQLDMALSNDAVAQWYTEDFMKKLGLL